ncbi:RES family NAD+ phosphorylase [Chlorobium sp. N1]|uniref:RES family NAD+ phosphorylase n=1 Tax=Chlorobium sp. N1 TaxID=2491138 RepID=UPI001F6254C4|nr:RES family NAD+ phosphorylase [Chlorobium sp. N1]
MSSPTWTPREVSSESFSWRGGVWRMVEDQYRVSTLKVVDSRREQELLEKILEEGKPPVPPRAENLDYLLYTPFRYPPHRPLGSRFRGPFDPGVYYGTERLRTAAAEISYRRWRFLQDAGGMKNLPSSTFTAFRTDAAGPAVDLRHPPWNRHERLWTAPESYEATQAFARTAREAPITIILYRSVRDPEGYGCMALLDPSTLYGSQPELMQNWTLTILPEEAVWQNRFETPFTFRTALFGRHG